MNRAVSTSAAWGHFLTSLDVTLSSLLYEQSVQLLCQLRMKDNAEDSYCQWTTRRQHTERFTSKFRFLTFTLLTLMVNFWCLLFSMMNLKNTSIEHETRRKTSLLTRVFPVIQERPVHRLPAQIQYMSLNTPSWKDVHNSWHIIVYSIQAWQVIMSPVLVPLTSK